MMNSLATLGGIPYTSMKNTTSPNRGRRSSAATSRAPVIVGHRRTMRAPRITQHGNRIVVEHREYIGSFETDPQNQFAYYAESLTPTNSSLFPWLAQIADRYESFRFKRLELSIESAAPSNTAGSWIVAVDYDATDPDINQTKASLMNMLDSQSCGVWQTATHRSKAANLNKLGPQRFNLEGDETPDRTNSAGVAYMAMTSVSGLQALSTTPLPQFVSVTFGERWVDYEVELFTPQLATALERRRPNEPQMRRNSALSAPSSALAGVAQTYQIASLLQPFGVSGSIGDISDQYAELVYPTSSASTLGAAQPGQWLEAELGAAAVAQSASGPGLAILHFVRDFEGLIKLTMPKLSMNPAALFDFSTVGHIHQWFYNGASILNAQAPNVIPNFDDNAFSVQNKAIVNDATGNGLVVMDVLARVAAGTGLTFETGQQTAQTFPAFTTHPTYACQLDICPMGLASGGAFLKSLPHRTVGRGPRVNGRHTRLEFVEKQISQEKSEPSTTVTFALLK